MSRASRPFLLALLAVIALATLVAACGKKGDPVLPSGEKDKYPQEYPQSTAPQTGVFSN
ncbi:MAG TPA: lipoprotein [Candidatus Cybelea sp.]|nr:lipoprotein [Candidatus Cybelea sp.]